MYPVVSVIIPVYNGEQYIGDAIESVRAQTHQATELIVINDGSTDGSRDQILRQAPEIFYETDNNGVVKARMKGIEHASGEFIAFLDQDDLWEPTKLKLQLDALRDNPEAQYAICQQQFFLDEGDTQPDWAKDEWFKEPQAGLLPSAFLVRSSFLESFNLFNSDLPITSDIDMFFRLRDASVPHENINQPLVRRRAHKLNQSADLTLVKSEIFRTIQLAMKRRRDGAK